MSFNLSEDSALDLPLKGSIGTFKVGSGNNKKTLDVKYILSHVGLNFTSGSDEKLLRELAPVREIFDYSDLDFDEIMQRDIDDARVSGDLIPYILDDSTAGLVKFFPPIVVVALPIEADSAKPGSYYDKVVERAEQLDKSGVEEWLVMQSGEIGSEVFRFEQPIVNGKPDQHNLVKLEINTSKCKLVIVDGQHRAMALLALYRNIKNQWSDARRKPFESYYREWTTTFINSFDLKDVQLPMILCTIPELDVDYQGDFDLKKACRSIFLTLNKNARVVSRSRNMLLNDNDLVASFMRKILSKIKNNSDILSDTSLQIHNIELDQPGDKRKIVSPMAMTGVPHLYYIIEHMLLDSGDINGISKREGKFYKRTTGAFFEYALSRLDALDTIGEVAFRSVKRDVFSQDDEKKLTASFLTKYGHNILKTFSSFSPFTNHNDAANKIKNDAEKHQDVHLKPMLFDGQGIARVFNSHLEVLTNRIGEKYFKYDVPKITALKDDLENTKQSYDGLVEDFEKVRGNLFLSNVQKRDFIDKSSEEVDTEILKNINTLYENVFSTIAFQCAIVSTFYNEFEKTANIFTGSIELDLTETYTEYLAQISAFFNPGSFSKLKNIFNLFIGATTGESAGSFSINKDSMNTFRKVVFPGEMSPDEWPKYRYLMLEIWEPSNQSLADTISQERGQCREEVAKSFYDRNKKAYLAQNKLNEDDYKDEDKEKVVTLTTDYYKEMLKNLGKASELNEAFVRKSMKK